MKKIIKAVFSFKGIFLILFALLVLSLMSISSTLESISTAIGTGGHWPRSGTGLIGAVESISTRIGHSGEGLFETGATGLYKAISNLR